VPVPVFSYWFMSEAPGSRTGAYHQGIGNRRYGFRVARPTAYLPGVRIGLVNQFRGRPGGEHPAPTWASIRERATVAEAVGFDMFVFEDTLLHRGVGETEGAWESMAVAAAIAATTRTIEFGQSVVNNPYRSPALVAKTAKTIDEISGGRYVLGIGAGGTDDTDYEAFGFPTDHRFSRFAESIEIIHTLLTTGRIDFDGSFYTARDAEIVLTGPRPYGPPINIAARGPKMLALTVRYADAWNWWESGPWSRAHRSTASNDASLPS